MLRRVADGEGIEAPDAALSLIARGARGAFRDAVSTLDQLAAATEGKVTVQAVLQLLGAVEEEALFRLCDLVVDRDTAGALIFVEELAEQGQDLGRLVTDLLEHLRHLLLVQHLGEVPNPCRSPRRRASGCASRRTSSARRRCCVSRPARRGRRRHAPGRRPAAAARARAGQGDAAGGRPRARVARLPDRAARGRRGRRRTHAAAAAPSRRPRSPPPRSRPDPRRRRVELEQLQDAWQRTVLPAVEQRAIPTRRCCGGPTRPGSRTHPTLEFPPRRTSTASSPRSPRTRRCSAMRSTR